MTAKRRSRGKSSSEKTEEFRVDPFAGLRVDLPDEPAKPLARARENRIGPEGTAKPETISPEDRDLLKAFGDAGAIEIQGRVEALTLGTEKRARGKVVTCIKGLKHLDALEQMELARELRKRLGIGARFNEGILELQGDQRERAMDWFQAQGYQIHGSA